MYMCMYVFSIGSLFFAIIYVTRTTARLENLEVDDFNRSCSIIDGRVQTIDCVNAVQKYCTAHVTPPGDSFYFCEQCEVICFWHIIRGLALIFVFLGVQAW